MDSQTVLKYFVALKNCMKDIIVKKKMPKVYSKLVNTRDHTRGEWDSVGCRLARGQTFSFYPTVEI